MDRYKFRAWDKKRKRMYEVLHLHLDSYDGIWATVKGFNIIEQKDIHIQIQPKDIILMQCTGLKDKNGKLIFEGDIVEITNNWYSENDFRFKYKSIVKWDKYSDGEYVDAIECYMADDESLSELILVKSNKREIEIIGNIHDKEVCTND